MLNYMKTSIKRVSDFIYLVNHIDVTQWDEVSQRDD